jgi:hypothetical protein
MFHIPAIKKVDKKMSRTSPQPKDETAEETEEVRRFKTKNLK